MFLLSFFLCGALCTFAQATDGDMLRVGLKYGSEAMSAANLQNYSAFGEPVNLVSHLLNL